MYDPGPPNPSGYCFGGADADQLLYHSGDASAPRLRWRQLLQQASARGWGEVRKYADRIMRLVAEPKVLFEAAGKLRAGGPKAAGPNGLSLDALDADELWQMCRVLGLAVATDTYRPGRELVVWIKKASGTGTRPIVLTDVQDRVVQKAAALVLQTALEMRFDPLCFSPRQQRTREHGIAVAEQLAAAHPVWLTHDLTDAFRRVPVNRLLDIVFKLLPCPRLRAFLARVLPPRARAVGGIKQGGPLSPLMLGVYLTHVLSEPWRKAGHPTRLLFYVDDLLLVAPDVASATAADAALRELLTPAGMLLKAPFAAAVRDIRVEPAEWLGFQFRLAGGKFRVRLGADAFPRLARRFLAAHAKPRPADRAALVLRHWAAQLGPSYRDEDRGAVVGRAFETAMAHGFEELPAGHELEAAWAGAHGRWRATRKLVRGTPSYLVTGPVVPPPPTSVIW